MKTYMKLWCFCTWHTPIFQQIIQIESMWRKTTVSAFCINLSHSNKSKYRAVLFRSIWSWIVVNNEDKDKTLQNIEADYLLIVKHFAIPRHSIDPYETSKNALAPLLSFSRYIFCKNKSFETAAQNTWQALNIKNPKDKASNLCTTPNSWS